VKNANIGLKKPNCSINSHKNEHIDSPMNKSLSSSLKVVAKLIRVYGIVQGVGFRESLRVEAENNRVTGWVRNRVDGSVEAFLQGSSESVDSVISWAHRGPDEAAVTKIDVFETEPSYIDMFEHKPTI
jgi:acylphosphatase